MSSENRIASRVGSPVSRSLIAALVLGIVAIITSVWALNSHNKVEELEHEISQIRAGASASVFQLAPTELAPNNAHGQVFISLSGSGIVIASGLPQPGDNEVFTLWYLQDDGTAGYGGALNVDENGQGYALIPGDTGDYAQIAISLEVAGSEDSAGNYLLVTEVQSGRG